MSFFNYDFKSNDELFEIPMSYSIGEYYEYTNEFSKNFNIEHKEMMMKLLYNFN